MNDYWEQPAQQNLKAQRCLFPIYELVMNRVNMGQHKRCIQFPTLRRGGEDTYPRSDDGVVVFGPMAEVDVISWRHHPSRDRVGHVDRDVRAAVDLRRKHVQNLNTRKSIKKFELIKKSTGK